MTLRLDPENACTVDDDAGHLGVHYTLSDSTNPNILGEPIAALDEDGDLTTGDKVRT